MSRRKLVSWNARPRSRAYGKAARGSLGANTGSIISPIAAAEPSMYTSNSDQVA